MERMWSEKAVDADVKVRLFRLAVLKELLLGPRVDNRFHGKELPALNEAAGTEVLAALCVIPSSNITSCQAS